VGSHRPPLPGHQRVDGPEVTSDQAGQTTIAGPVTDQAAPHGPLAKIRDLGLPLLLVRQLNPDR
jgi:hypothetical protein